MDYILVYEALCWDRWLAFCVFLLLVIVYIDFGSNIHNLFLVFWKYCIMTVEYLHLI